MLIKHGISPIISISTSSTVMAATPAILSLLVILMVTFVNVYANEEPAQQDGQTGSAPKKEFRTTDTWKDAHATFYGPPEGTLGVARSTESLIYGLDYLCLDLV